MFRSERVLRIICFEPFFLAFNPGSCPQSHTGQGFSSCVFSCQRAKKSIVLGRFPFQFELWFFLIWSWSIPVGASETRCSTRVFAVSKTASTDHGRHESTKCEKDSKSGSRASGSWVRIPPYPPESSAALPAGVRRIFTVGTICVALAAGLPLGYALFSYAKHNGIFGMNVYHVPLIPILVMILLVGILQIVLSLVLSSNLKKETLVERIRYQG